MPVGAGITRVLLHFGFMETPNEGLKFACLEPDLRGIDPQNITYYFWRVIVIQRQCVENGDLEKLPVRISAAPSSSVGPVPADL